MANRTPALVTTEWVADRLDDPGIRIVEVDEDASAYHASHIPGAVGFDWRKDLQDGTRRTFVGREGLRRRKAPPARPPPHLRRPRGIRAAARPRRHHQRHPRGPLRRLQQLVRRPCVLVPPNLPPPAGHPA